MAKLTNAKVKSIKKPGLHTDGQTLYLRVAPGGSKAWVQRVMINGKRHDIGLGGWPVVSLEKARRRAFQNRIAISDGRDPLADKRKAKVPYIHERRRSGRMRRSNPAGAQRRCERIGGRFSSVMPSSASVIFAWMRSGARTCSPC